MCGVLEELTSLDERCDCRVGLEVHENLLGASLRSSEPGEVEDDADGDRFGVGVDETATRNVTCRSYDLDVHALISRDPETLVDVFRGRASTSLTPRV